MMMKPLVPAALSAALLLGACEDGTPDRNMTSIHISVPASDQLKGMSELYRYLGLRRAIVDSGQRCKKVDRGAYQQDWNNLAMWTAHCTDTGDWAIFIAPNDDVQVRQCGDVAQLKLPACKPIQAPAPYSPSAKPMGRGTG
jgi:hypothetical protein